MNWYKQALEVIDQGSLGKEQDEDGHYTDIGHDWYYGYEDDFKAGNFNYMWKLINGTIEVEKETEENMDHSTIERWRNVPKSYGGRYDSSRKMLSIIRPQKGSAKFRQIPQAIKDILKQKFTGAE